jgi:hypothetical protein
VGKLAAYGTEGPKTKRSCWNCGSEDHLKNECTKDLVKCKRCGKRGHLERFCKSSPQEEGRRKDTREREKKMLKKKFLNKTEGGEKSFFISFQ